MRLRVVQPAEPEPPVDDGPEVRIPWPLKWPTPGERRTDSTIRLTKADEAIGRFLYPERFGRPRTRADCADVPRPCPFVGCRFNLYLDLNLVGNIRYNYNCEPWEMAHSCVLDLADEMPRDLKRIGELLGLSRERVRQIEHQAMEHAARLDVDVDAPTEPVHWSDVP